MKRLTAACILTICLIAPASSSGHSTGWHWTENAAEEEVMDRYYDVEEVACDGVGRAWKRKYRHFDCTALTDEGDEIEFRLHVRGRYRFSVNFY